MILLARCCCPKMQKHVDSLGSYLYWTGSMRLFVEGYMDIALFTFMNLKHVEWDSEVAVNVASTLAASFLLVIIVVLPVAVLIYVACKRQAWNDEAFRERNEAILDGIDLERNETQWVGLLIPMAYFLRRLLMSLTLVFWAKFFWGQVAIQFLTSTALVILLGWFRPLDSAYANNMEILTEMATLCILYMVCCFSNYVPEPETRHLCGFAFIGILATFVAIHLVMLLYGAYMALRYCIRHRYYEGKRRKVNKANAVKRQAYLKKAGVKA